MNIEFLLSIYKNFNKQAIFLFDSFDTDFPILMQIQCVLRKIYDRWISAARHIRRWFHHINYNANFPLLFINNAYWLWRASVRFRTNCCFTYSY